MLWLYIILGVIFVFILLLISLYIIAKKLHNKLFQHRYQNDPRIRYYTKEEFNLGFKSVEIKLEDEILRGGLYFYPDYDEKKIFILNHGMWSGVDSYIQDIEYFASKGYLVLAMNYEGTLESSGKNIRGLSNSLRCVDYIVKYVKENEELKNKDIYVVGHSWGGFATVNIPYYHKDIKGILAIAPFYNVNSCMKGFLPKPLWISLPFYDLIERKLCGKYAKANALKTLKEFKGNIVILHSENDKMVKFKYNTNMLMKQNLKNASFLIFKDKDHNPHYSYSALECFNKFFREISSLSEEDKTEYMKNTDFHKMGELDKEVLDKALKLLLKEE